MSAAPGSASRSAKTSGHPRSRHIWPAPGRSCCWCPMDLPSKRENFLRGWSWGRPAHVKGVCLPSAFTSQISMEEAQAVADRLGIRLLTVPIAAVADAAEHAMAPVFEGRARDVAEENLQARIRGLLLMALSNKFGDMLLTTGNESEMSVGYATLYGDMCGGYSVLKDIDKTDVYRLSRWRNCRRPKGA